MRLSVWMPLVTVLLAVAAYIVWRWSSDRRLFLPAATTSGHHQIETECMTCHTPFGGVQSEACVGCHGDELERVDDSHPKSKFTDPRNADRLQKLDARECVACHVEHRPERTRAMGVTLPVDLCHHCHADIATERPSHDGLGTQTCQDAGCHNFHDNRALNADFLRAQLAREGTSTPMGVLPTSTRSSRALGKSTRTPLADHDVVQLVGRVWSPAIVDDWATTTHAAAGVGCTDCHQESTDDGWRDAVSWDTCKRCHEDEAAGFSASRHGMRLGVGLAAMRVADARLKMREDAEHRTVTCTSCHGEHRFDRVRAGVDACVTCHDDEHSRAYLSSKHYALWTAEVSGSAAPGSGVSCASCHLPRVPDMAGAPAKVRHNQNDFLRPNDKLLASVCVNCHGIEFAMDALADPAVIARGVNGTSTVHVQSAEMVRRGLAARAADRGAGP